MKLMAINYGKSEISLDENNNSTSFIIVVIILPNCPV